MACEVLRVLMSTSGSSEKMEAILETVLSNHYFPAIVKHMAAHSKKWLPWCPLMLMYLAQGLGSSLVAFSYKEQVAQLVVSMTVFKVPRESKQFQIVLHTTWFQVEIVAVSEYQWRPITAWLTYYKKTSSQNQSHPCKMEILLLGIYHSKFSWLFI